MVEPIQAVLIGAGERGMNTYGAYALDHPDQIHFIAVAEPDPLRRGEFASKHQIPPERQYSAWEPLLSQSAIGRAALICTQDTQHTGPTIAALESGYEVLLEKPMAVTPVDCLRIVQISESTGKLVQVCHTMRYTRHFTKMRSILQSGVLGQIVDVAHRENVSWWHMAHSYVRGNWGSCEESSPMILAKCCHDLDILIWLLDDHCKRISSTGNLLHFRSENAPEGAAARCLDGCAVREICPYDAASIYLSATPLWRSVMDSSIGLTHIASKLQLKSPRLIKTLSYLYPPLKQIRDYRGWPLSVVAQDPTPQNIQESLRTGPYGRCVYHCGNDVVDHQVVMMEFSSGLSATLTMHGHSHLEGRTTRIEGSRGRLTAFFGIAGSWIQIDDHQSDRCSRFNTSDEVGKGHGGGDQAILSAFVDKLRDPHKESLTTASQSLESHLMAFAAEEARLNHQVINFDEYRRLWG